ncbi:MAG TPA: pseudaminic acid biosynthesis-associated methylase [Candidatus Paceibacterota bacterium]|nr:pseudaminic acid biosynthesis-associated methylase [Verrucomicrobiota bacterium]HSA09922.1 pseudaminic acid biosynthesis-associated methylase [Candidatus Paceibacterota bacterium]
MTAFKTEQEEFWAGEFGDDYAARNRGTHWVARNVAFCARVLQRTERIRSVIEFGANIGLNLQAIRLLLPEAKLSAVEINEKAVRELRQMPEVEVHHESVLDYTGREQHDLVLIKGVLIHLNPDNLPQVYDLLYQSSARYICLAEYYNPTPVEVPYRGHSHRLFKRDFAGDMMERFKDLHLLDYGFVYRRDLHFPQDDLTWFLLRKGPEARGDNNA